MTSKLAAVQATVRHFDPTTGSGSALLDDGSEVEFDGEAFAAGGLNLLRPGQRVRLDVATDEDTETAATEGGRVVRVTIWTMP